MIEKAEQLLQRLSELTREGKIPWEETACSKTFQVSFLRGSVQVRKRGDDCMLIIFNENADEVGKVGCGKDLENLYNDARGVARNASGTIEALLVELGKIQ